MRSQFTVSLLLIFVFKINTWCQINKYVDVNKVTSIDYSPDGTMVLTVTASRITVWERISKKILFVKTGANIYFAKFSKNSPSSYIVISSNNSNIQLISGISPFASIQSWDAGHGGGQAVGVDFTSNTNLITCGGQTNRFKTWDISVNPALNTYSSTVAQMGVCAVSTSTRIGTATSNNKLYYNSVGGGITNLLTINANSCERIAFSPDGLYMTAACSSAGGVSGYFINTNTLTSTNLFTSGDLYTTSYAGDSQTFCFGGNTKRVFILNGTSGNKTILSQFVTNSQIYSSDFTDDGFYLSIGTLDGTIYQYAKYCLYCRPGYYANLTTKLCVQCQTSMQGCSNCINSTKCVQCYQNYIYNSALSLCQSCSGLIQGCGTCLNSTYCRYCMSGYYLISSNSTCAKCQSIIIGCYACNSTVCYQCQSDFYLQTSNNTCIACQNNNPICIKCVNKTYCTTCKLGYYESSGVCNACPTNCYMCQSNTNCTDCALGYYPMLSGSTTTCTKCSTGCLACNATGYCRNCDDQRYLTSGTCTLCSYPCLTCNSSNYCLSCQSAFFFNGVGGCIECSSGCTSCNSSSICLSCSAGYYLDTGTDTCKQCELLINNCMQCTNITCLKCQIGYYQSSPTQCSRCVSTMYECAACTSSTSCYMCSSGFYKGTGTGNSSCQVCVLGCATCISSTNCTSCNVGYYYTSTASTCSPCQNNCVVCNTSTYCLQCEIGFSLGPAGTCVSCSSRVTRCQSCVYNYTASAFWCISCQQNTYLDITTGGCLFCPQNCTTCYNSTVCQSCQTGLYLSASYSCLACHSNCSECFGAANNCTSCIAGYYLSSSFSCLHCSVFGCATCNSTNNNCLSCQIGFYLKTVAGLPTQICDNCLSAISNCYICKSSTLCSQCSYGYALATNFLSCTKCSSVEGCKHCITLTSCQNCQIGYYLSTDGSGNGICNKCPAGCKQCDSTGVCLICFYQYIFTNILGTITCQLCQNSMTGCLTCNSSTVCTNCMAGYYKNITNQCELCSVPIFACQYCNSSSICTRCQDGYYLNSTNICQKCETIMTGCIICNSSSICLSCQFGMYLNGNSCYRCSIALPNCLYCLNLTTCLTCDSGSYLTSGSCSDCQAQIPGCILCASASTCLQCKGGYYLNSTTNLCMQCREPGCQICRQSNPLQCIRCNTRYYFNSTQNNCIKCRSLINGCLQCTNSTHCSKCDPGYFLNSSYQCQLCQQVLTGCGRCAAVNSCLQCKATYYLLSNNTCSDCKLSLIGCSFCINETDCQSCYHGYYKTSSNICQSCTQIQGCLSCLNSTYCQYCQASYFLQSTQNLCYSCSVIQGCYACTNNLTCAICTGGYVLNDEQLCQVMRVQAHQTVKDLKLVSKYLNQSCLIHYLYARDMSYNKSNEINWTKTTKLILQDSTYAQTQLTILHVEWGTNNDYTLIFYTDNPLKLQANQLPITGRLLLSQPITAKYKVNLKMDQATINTILPDFFMPKDLVMNYNINSPEFVMSFLYVNSKLYYYSIFGYVVTTLLLIKYIFKAVYSVPISPQMGQIIPQVLALKSPAFILYPGYFQWYFYCLGFTIPDFPWLNQFFGTVFANQSDQVPKSFAMFYKNLNIGSTFIIGISIIIFTTFVMWLLYNSKKHAQYIQRFPIGNVLFNFFLFNATWAACSSLQGALLNPIQVINLNSCLYMVGIAFYCTIFAICIYKTYENRRNLPKLRIFVKASLLSFCNMSPIYIFFSAILVDIVIILIEHFFVNREHSYPKIWILKNILCNLALILLTTWPSALVSLAITSFLIVLAIVLDVYTHIKQSKQMKSKRKFKVDQIEQNQSSLDVNIWNINFKKINQQQFQKQLQKDMGMQNQARRTGFASTNASQLFNQQKKTKYESRRKFKKTKKAEDRPDVINIHNNQPIQKQEVEDLANIIPTFLVKTSQN